MRKLITLFFALITVSLFAGESDSTSKRSLIVVPIGYYQPETSVALGAAGGYYFKSKDLKKISSISYSAIYTFKNQFIFNVSPKIFSKNKKNYFYGALSARYYPDLYFFRGEGLDYVSRYFQFIFQPQRFITNKWSVGLNYFARYESPINFERDVFHSPIPEHIVDVGSEAYYVQGFGFVSTYDSRNNLYYPEKGFFAKLSYWYSPEKINWHADGTGGMGIGFTLENLNLDIRHYVPLGKKHIFAYQIYAVSMSGLAPFQIEPTIGGADKMRGFREGRFRSQFLGLVQGEYRFPIYKRLKGVAFGGVTTFENIWHTTHPYVSYGAGLRYRLNDARVHLRFDYAFTNYNESNFYITATEAF